MPHKNSDRLSQVELLLEGKRKVAHLFHCEDRGTDGDKSVSSTNQSILTIPKFLHYLVGKDITVKRGGIDLSLMTRKNMTNCCDITGETLYRHAKDVEANLKKALALCLEESSPYRNFNGTFPSGTNWEDFLLWIRQQMFTIQNKIPVEDFIDEDLLETGNAFSLPNDGDCSTSDEAVSVPEEEYFKVFFAFALFGYIPPDGGEKIQKLFNAYCS